MDRMLMKWKDGEFETFHSFVRELEMGIKLYRHQPDKKEKD